MSMISKLLDNLEEHAKAYETGESEGKITAITTAKVLRDAIWTIETQGQKLQAYNLNGGWIPVEEGVPDNSLVKKITLDINGRRIVANAYYWGDTRSWVGTDYPSKPILSEDKGYKVIAWQPDPEPYEE